MAPSRVVNGEERQRQRSLALQLERSIIKVSRGAIDLYAATTYATAMVAEGIENEAALNRLGRRELERLGVSSVHVQTLVRVRDMLPPPDPTANAAASAQEAAAKDARRARHAKRVAVAAKVAASLPPLPGRPAQDISLPRERVTKRAMAKTDVPETGSEPQTPQPEPKLDCAPPPEPAMLPSRPTQPSPSAATPRKAAFAELPPKDKHETAATRIAATTGRTTVAWSVTGAGRTSPLVPATRIAATLRGAAARAAFARTVLGSTAPAKGCGRLRLADVMRARRGCVAMQAYARGAESRRLTTELLSCALRLPVECGCFFLSRRAALSRPSWVPLLTTPHDDSSRALRSL